MNRDKHMIILIIIALLFPLFSSNPIMACTTAIISPAASAQGVPMLWKNRDTDFLSNKVIYVEAQPYSYLGLINAGDTSGRFVYAGLNAEGFGIMNSVAYNLTNKKDDLADLEGILMAEALRTCRTVDDFEHFIQKNLGASMGSQANFGVIDVNGNAMIFEVSNWSYKKYNTADDPQKYMVNTNFSRSGTEGAGAGYLRFEQASSLFNQLKGQKITHEFIFQTISRSFAHPLLQHPSLTELEKHSATKPIWLYTNDCINRNSTSAAVIMCGKKPNEKDSLATFWVILGEPVTSIAVPLWVEAQTTPAALREGEECPITTEALRIKKIIRPSSEGNKDNYMLASKLVNLEKTGFLKLLLATEQEIFQETALFLKSKHTPSELAQFQNHMAEKALSALKKISQ